ncbi:hypothetical protein [Shimia sp. SDUM112013]|uniref:hypothetical protein n=1 Tax=Shimia sp. SDUM112013 TaxID=3136160 RepID=UPI0032EF844B
MKVIKDLLLALINATLLLAAVCLFFLWQVSNTVERAAGAFAAQLNVLEPVSTELGNLTAEVAALRGDMQVLASSSGELASVTAQRIQARVDRIQTDLDTMRANTQQVVANAKAAPEKLVTTAVTTATDNLSTLAFDLRGCTRPES